MSLGDRLREAREDAKYFQIDVKEKTGINNKTLSNYEKNVSSPDPITLKLLADLYNVTTDWLISGKPPKSQGKTSNSSSDSKISINNVILEKYIRPTLLNLAKINPVYDPKDIEYIKIAPKEYLVERFHTIADLVLINGELKVKFKEIDPEVLEIYEKIKNLSHEKRKILLRRLIDID